MILSSKTIEKELHKEDKLKILFVFPLMFLIFGVFIEFTLDSSFVSIIQGLKKILISPTILITDFLVIGGMGASFINSSLIGFLNLYILRKYEMRINGLLIAAFMTVLGFSFFGKNLYNIMPIYLGGYLYCKFQNISIKEIILIIMFTTGLSPIVSEISYAGIFPAPYSIIFGMLIGVFLGFCTVPLSSHMLKFHDGFNLYNIGFTAGIVGTVFTSILRSFDITINPVEIIYLDMNYYMLCFFIALFVYLMIVGVYVNASAFKDYYKILKYKGRTITDFTHLVGYGITFFNMGLMGLLSIAYVIIVGGVINGPVIAAIFTIVGFSAFGKHPRNSLPIMIGVIIAAVAMGYDLSSTGIIISVLFSTTIAPIAGTYGPIIGILAGMLHMALVTNIGVIHGGINLYNNGFSGGLVAGFLVPIIDAFKKGE
ncbi:MAG: DUF1576 domain-containing protein [Acidaminobacteraceae bacterium]